jgi:sulfur-carrier protein
MMMVTFYATLRQIVGSRQAEFSGQDGCTLRQLIAEMVGRYPALRSEILDEDGNLYGHIHIFINGRDSTLLDDSMETQIASGDTVSVFPPVGGG